MRSGHKLVAKDIPQAAVGFVKAFLAVNFKDVARPSHRNVDDVFDLPWTVGHDHDPIRHPDRLAHRWGLSNGKTVTQTEADLKSLFPIETWNDLHLQIIYFGREHCAARGCDGLSCLICKHLNVKN